MIDIVVVAYRSDPFVARWVADLPKMTRTPYRLHLFDNTGRQRNLAVVKNELAAASTGDWIFFANADVLVAPEWDSRLISFLESHPDIGMALPLPGGDPRYTEFWRADIPEKYFAEGLPAPETMARISERLADNDKFHLFDTGDFFCPFFSVLMRRETWAALKGFDERFRLFGSDRDMSWRLRLIRNQGVAGVRSVGFYHAGGASLAAAEAESGFDRAVEWEHRSQARHRIKSGQWQKWHDLGDEDRRTFRNAPEFLWIGGKAPSTEIDGVRTVELKEIPDERGSLCEVFRTDLFPGLPARQVNRMISKAGTLRGNHVHRDHSDVFVLASGKAVVGLKDVRKSSSSFGAVRKVELQAQPPRALVVPPGVVHGVYFPVDSVLLTVETHLYNPEEEIRVAWNDPALGIDYGNAKPILSAEDRGALSYDAVMAKIEPWQKKYAMDLGFISVGASPRLSIIIPTIDRESLEETLDSLEPQLGPEDQVVIVGDGRCPGARRRTAARGARYVYAETPETKNWGHPQRNLGMDLAKGDYLWFLDDDDTAMPGALDAIRREAALSPGRPLIFRMAYEDRVVWTEPVLKIDNVSTQMLVLPNVPSRLARWTRNPGTESGRGGDFTFAWTTTALWPDGAVLFRSDIIARLVVHGHGAKVTGAPA